MTAIETDVITRLVADKDQEILTEWLDLLKEAGALQTGRMNVSELTVQCGAFLRLFNDALAKKGALMSPIQPIRLCGTFLVMSPDRGPYRGSHLERPRHLYFH